MVSSNRKHNKDILKYMDQLRPNALNLLISKDLHKCLQGLYLAHAS